MEKERMSEEWDEGRYIQCNKCSYEWATKSKAKFPTCPNCSTSVRSPYWVRP